MALLSFVRVDAYQPTYAYSLTLRPRKDSRQHKMNVRDMKLMLGDPNLFYYNIDPNVVPAVNPDNSLTAFVDSFESTFFKSVTLRLLGTILGILSMIVFTTPCFIINKYSS